MAIYKEDAFLVHLSNEVFDDEHAPGTPAPREGIYRCVGCGREVAAKEDAPLPAREHHSHEPLDPGVGWQLIVFADHRPKRKPGPPQP